MNQTVQDYLHVWSIDKGYVYFDDGSVGRVLGFCPKDPENLSDQEKNALSAAIKDALAELPEHISVQFQLSVTNDKPALQEQDADELPFYHDLFIGRQEFLLCKAEEGESRCYQGYVILRDKGAFFGSPLKSLFAAEAALNPSVNRLRVISSNLVKALDAAGIMLFEPTDEEILERIYWTWNPGAHAAHSPDRTEDIKFHAAKSDINLEQDFFQIGGMLHRMLSLYTLPEATWPCMSNAMKQIPIGSTIYYTINVPSQEKEKDLLKRQQRIAFSLANSNRAEAKDIDSQAKFEDIESLLEDLTVENERVLNISMSVLITAEDKRTLNDRTSTALNLFRKVGGAEAICESLASFYIFAESCFPNGYSSERLKKVKSINASDLVPLYGPWKGTNQNLVTLRSREGSVVHFDPFDGSHANANQLICGGSGSGKSFLTNLILLQSLRCKPRVIVIDIGGSYKRICQALQGQYVTLSLDAKIGINPFESDEQEATPRKVRFLTSLIELMLAEEDKGRLTKLERSIIEECVQTTYAKNRTPTLSAFKSILESHPSLESDRLASSLASWTGGSPFGRILDRATSVDLEKDFICFDLTGLSATPELQSAMLLIITDLVFRSIQADRHKKKFLVFDECWKLLESPAGSSFIAESFRTFRKYNASAIAISQNIDDFCQSQAANAILPNTSIRWILQHRGSDPKRLKAALSLNENQLQNLLSLKQIKGFYSEVFLMTPEASSVVQIEPTPLEYWLATTDPRDIAELEKKTSEEEGQYFDYLKQLSFKYPHGVMKA